MLFTFFCEISEVLCYTKSKNKCGMHQSQFKVCIKIKTDEVFNNSHQVKFLSLHNS